MVRSFAAVTLVAAAAATLLSVADAHSNMNAPAPKWPAGFYNGNSPVGTVDSTKFTGAGASIVGYQPVKKMAAELGTGDLRSFIYQRVNLDMAGANKECGKTLLDGTPYAVPAEIDFPWGHPGPCAAYCDDTKIFYNEDCQGNAVGKIKVDQSKCSGAKKLQVMYLGVHVSAYQYYVNCVPLSGGGGGGAAGGGTSDTGGNNGGTSGGSSGVTSGGSTGGNSGGNNGGTSGGNGGGNSGGNTGGSANTGNNNSNGANSGGTDNNKNNSSSSSNNNNNNSGATNGGINNNQNNGGNKNNKSTSSGNNNNNNNNWNNWNNQNNQNNRNNNRNTNSGNSGNNNSNRSYNFGSFNGKRQLRAL